jgi:hypothetical protein
MTDRSPRRTPLLVVGILTVVLHQLIALWLYFYEFMRGKAAAPDVIGYVLHILCWPFVLASQDPLHLHNSLLITSWFFGSLFWASIVCLIVALYRTKRPRDVRD